MTRAGWASGSDTLLAGANEVFDRMYQPYTVRHVTPVTLDGTDRVLDVPPQSTVIINVRGLDVSIITGAMILPAGMSPTQVLIH